MSNKLYDITGEVKLDLTKFYKALQRADKEMQKLHRGQGKRKGLNSKNKLDVDNKIAVRRLKQVSNSLKSLKKHTNLGTLKLNVGNVNQSLSRVDKQLARIRKNASKPITMPPVKGPKMPNVPAGHTQPGATGGQGGGGRGGVAFIPPGGGSKGDGRNIGDKIADYGRSPLSMGNLLGGAMLGNMMSKAMDFQSRMGMTYGKMGDVSPEQEREVRDLVLDVASKSPKTSVEVSEVSEVLAGMGYDVKDMKNSLQSNVDLSVATASDPQLVADTLSGIIKTYDTSFSIADTDRVSDKISQAINMSSLGMQQYAESSKYVDPVFAAAGVDFEEGLALQAMLADKNIKGSGAGTGLKNFLYGAISNKKEDKKRLKDLGIKTRDETGAFSLEETLSSLNATMEEHRKKGTEDEFVDRLVESFGRDGASAIAALATYSSDEFQSYKGKLSDEESAGATAKLVEKATDNLAGDWNSLMSAVESSFNRMVTDNDSPLRGVVQKITDLVRWFDGLSNESKKLALQIAAAAVGFPILINVVGRTVSALIKFGKFINLALTPLKLLSKLVFPPKAPSSPKTKPGGGGGGKGGKGGKNGGKGGKGGGGGGKAIQLVQFAKTPSVKIAGCVKLCKGSGEKGGKGGVGVGVGGGKGGKGPKKSEEASKRNEKAGTGFGKNVMKFAKGIPVIGGLAGAIYSLKNMSADNVGATVGGMGAGAVGGAAGAALGSMVMPGVGTVIGGVGGSLLGSFAGSKAGGYLDDNADLLDFTPLKDKATNAKNDVVDTFSGVGPAITSAMSGIGSSISSAFSSFISGIGSFASTIGSVFMSIFTSIGSVLVGVFTSLIGVIGSVLGTIVQVIVNIFSAIPGVLASIFGAIASTIVMVLTMLFSSIFSIMSGIASVIATVFTSLVSIIGGILSSLFGVISSVISGIFSFIVGMFSAMIGVIGGIFSALFGIISSVVSAIFGFIVSMFSAIVSVIAGLLSAMLGIVTSIFSALFGFISSILSSLLSFFVSIFTTMISVAVSLLSALLSAVVSVFSAVVSAVVSAGARVVTAVISFMGRAVQAVFSFAGRAFSAGANFVAGIARGIASGASAVISAASNIAKQAFSAFKRSLGIRSPSRVMMRVARWVPIGVAEGIKGEEAVVADSMARMSSLIAGGLDVPDEELPQITNPFAAGTNTNPLNPKRTMTAAGLNDMLGSGTVEVDRIIVNVDQLTDLSPQLVQSTVSAPFFDEARRRQ